MPNFYGQLTPKKAAKPIKAAAASKQLSKASLSKSGTKNATK
jgi:hypothetical protein